METGTPESFPALAVILVLGIPVLLLGLGVATFVLARKVKAARQVIQDLESRFRPVISLDEEVTNIRRSIHTSMAERERLQEDTEKLRAEYAVKRQIYNALQDEVGVLEGRLDASELGFYEPTLSFDTSAEYAAALKENQAQQKAMVKDGTAVFCTSSWTVEGSASKGRTMTNRNIRMTVRAFNNECDVLISKATWKNMGALLIRLEKARKAYDDMNKSNAIFISDMYMSLKIAELEMSYEESLRKNEERERLREERAREREDLKAQKELEDAANKAEADEFRKSEALAAARAELEATGTGDNGALLSRIEKLEAQLADAHAATQRAISMAQKTRAGHVYVISNIGSFGEQVVKVGMTRRLEPLERVHELGDASVPFPFDIHAMIFTEDAPTLERELHTALEAYRVNRVNARKEFFRAPLDVVKATVLEKLPHATFIQNVDAQEYLSSLSRDEAVTEAAHAERDLFPANI